MERAIAEPSARLVAEAMTTAVVTVAPGASVEAARRLARALGAHHLLVIDEGTLVGILCRCDLDEAEPGSEVSDCMSVPVMTIPPDASLAAAVATMADFEVGCLPVVAGGLIMGVLSEDELARAGTAAPGAAGRCRCHRRTRLPAAR
ncbi:MAG TPA: CBS domain-containing protein [Anaeromyxobacteraceae bacterium]